MSYILILLRIVRLPSAIYPLLSLALGLSVSGRIDIARIVLLLSIIIMLNSSAMIWNDIEDKQLDSDNGRLSISKAQLSTLISLKQAAAMFVLFSITAAALIDAFTLFVTSLTVFVVWIYNSKPVQASRRPIMSIIILSCAGAFLPYVLGLSYGGITSTTIVAGLFWWLGRISLSVLKDYKDAYGDSRNHKKTFLLYFGALRTAQLSIVSLLIGYGGFIWFMHYKINNIWLALVAICGLGLLAYMRLGLLDKKGTYTKFDSIFRKVIQYQILLDAGLVICLTW